VTIVYGALAAVASPSLMRLAAFASISHAGFMVLGLFGLTQVSMTGAMTYVGAHALSASALLLVAEQVVQRRGDTLHHGAFGGLARRAPVLAGVFLVAGLATLSLPGTANFAAELMVIMGAWARFPVVTAVSLIGVLAAAVYVLWTYQRVFTGDADGPPNDIGPIHRLAIGLLLAAVIALGVYPSAMQQLVTPNVTTAVQQTQEGGG